MLWIAKLADTLPYGVWQKVLFRTPSLLIVMGILIFYAQKLSRRHVDNETDDTFMSPLA